MRLHLRTASVALCLLTPFAAGCVAADQSAPKAVASVAPAGDRRIDALIETYAAKYGVPAGLVRAVVARESGFDPKSRHRGNWGLMQIKAATARTMGYRGPARGLLDAETNLDYGVKYLRGAYLVSRGDAARAMAYYRSGYYYRAKRMGLLEEAGLR